MIAKELIYQDYCILYGNQFVDSEGDTSYEVLYQGLCDFQPNRTIVVKGMYTQAYPTLYLPYYEAKDLDFVTNGRIEIKRSGCGKYVKANLRSCDVINIFDKLVGIEISLADVQSIKGFTQGNAAFSNGWNNNLGWNNNVGWSNN